ncbi:DUF4303 domain-containing protein [Chitinimonas lacunae]|uniref:DUF4303 domain-containing protein n=1 Tax=Chitinimonas lacunae TaxID=1963018 RepID=A0ABV8MYP1_9NEIS
MRVQAFKEILQARLTAACQGCLQDLPAEIEGDKIYAFSIYADSGCTSLGVAFATQGALERKNRESAADQLRAFVNTLNAAEWPYVNYHYELFEAADELVDEFYDCLFDGELEDVEFDPQISTAELTKFASDIFVEVIVRSLLDLKAQGYFSGDAFTDDPLLGLQFGDPSDNGVNMMEDVSRQVNSAAWHEKMVRNCHYLKHGLPR